MTTQLIFPGKFPPAGRRDTRDATRPYACDLGLSGSGQVRYNTGKLQAGDTEVLILLKVFRATARPVTVSPTSMGTLPSEM
jgi:hypothetical protein